MNTITYKGNQLKRQVNYVDEILRPYNPSTELIRAVNHAIILERPLLLKGEPGCGKTLLAKAVAHEFDAYPDRYFEWRVKSTSKALDGLYTFDHLARLRDVQAKSESNEDLKKYVTYGPLGEAFRVASDGSNKPVILLIDEIDKADIDFPNDLLHEIEQKSFEIAELRELGTETSFVKLSLDNNLIIFITSNNEKELPGAFLRRCLFHFIEFPDENRLKEIVKMHFPNLDQEISAKLVAIFKEVRGLYADKIPHDKSPATSELLDWCRLIQYYAEKDNDKEVEKIINDISVLHKSENGVKTIKIPHNS